jgi:hypothetical protein
MIDNSQYRDILDHLIATKTIPDTNKFENEWAEPFKHPPFILTKGTPIPSKDYWIDPEWLRAGQQTAQAQTPSDGSSTDYYKFPTGFSDLIDLIEFKNMNFAIGNIFKACFRLGEKAGNDRAYDLRKIIFFAQRELARIESGTKV